MYVCFSKQKPVEDNYYLNPSKNTREPISVKLRSEDRTDDDPESFGISSLMSSSVTSAGCVGTVILCSGSRVVVVVQVTGEPL